MLGVGSVSSAVFLFLSCACIISVIFNVQFLFMPLIYVVRVVLYNPDIWTFMWVQINCCKLHTPERVEELL